MHSAIVISSSLLKMVMKTKTMCSLSVAAIFAVAIGMTGQIPLAAADSWETSNGLQAPSGTITGKIYEAYTPSNTIIASATSIDLSLAKWNGFEADNFFGTSYSQELSTSNNEFRAFAVQMSAESPNHDSVINSDTAVDLSLATWNGFEADNFFGTGLN